MAPNVGGYGADRVRSVRPCTDRVSEPARIARRGLRQSAHAPYTRLQTIPKVSTRFRSRLTGGVFPREDLAIEMDDQQKQPVAVLLLDGSRSEVEADRASADCRNSGHENSGPGGSVWPRAYGRVIRDRGLLGERRRQAVLDDGPRARAFWWPPLRLARIVLRARIGLCRSPAASPAFVDLLGR